MSEHPIAQQIIELLEQHNCWHKTYHHEHVRTSLEAQDVRQGYTLAQGGKALIVRAKIKGEGKQFVMLVLPGDKKFDSKKAKKAMNASDMRFATEEEVKTITDGVKPGGVPPFGSLFNIKVIADKTMFDDETCIFNAGRNYSIAMRTKDYKKLVQPIISDFAA